MAVPIIATAPFWLQVLGVFSAYKLVRLTSKVMTRLLIFAVIVGLFLALLAAINAMLDAIAVVCPDMIIQAYSMFLPSNFVLCVTAVATVQLMILAWHWKKHAIDYAADGVN